MSGLKARECGHAEILPAGRCELCDVDWLIRERQGNQRENRVNRREIVQQIQAKKAGRKEL